MSSQHVPYIRGDTHPTMEPTTSSNGVTLSQSFKRPLSSDCGLQLARMKPESVVIANQKVAVNSFSLLVQLKYAPSAHTYQLVEIQPF
jgi:hypothetical protein